MIATIMAAVSTVMTAARIMTATIWMRNLTDILAGAREFIKALDMEMMHQSRHVTTIARRLIPAQALVNVKIRQATVSPATRVARLITAVIRIVNPVVTPAPAHLL